MTTVPLLLIGMVAGYNFASNCIITRYALSRKRGYSLYFITALYGIYLLFISFCVSALLGIIGTDSGSLKTFVITNYGFFSTDVFENSQILDSILVAIMTIVISWSYKPINLFMKIPVLQKRIFESAIKNRDFEKLIWRAIRNKFLVQLTMSNNKVYVGYVIWTIDPEIERTELRILPVLSGFRNSEGSIIFKNMYTVVLEKLKKEPIEEITSDKDLDSSGLANFEIVLPYSEIRHTGLFDFEIYIDTNNSFKKGKKKGLKK